MAAGSTIYRRQFQTESDISYVRALFRALLDSFCREAGRSSRIYSHLHEGPLLGSLFKMIDEALGGGVATAGIVES